MAEDKNKDKDKDKASHNDLPSKFSSNEDEDKASHNDLPSESSSNGVRLRWYVIHVHSNYEAYVIRTLMDRIRVAGVEHRFGEIIVPTEEVIEMRAGKKRKVERKFFPGYILLQMDMGNDMWYLVRNTPKVLGFIGGTAEKPASISDQEAMSILQRVEEGEKKPRHKVLFEPGEYVRVTDGPFADFNGTVEDVNYEKSRLKVSVSIFGRSTPIELEFTQVEKA